MQPVNYQPIGIIRTPFKERIGTPRQAVGASQYFGTIEIDAAFELGIQDLASYSHLLVLFHFHLIEGPQLLVQPSWSAERRGVFSSVAPHRPNPIGLSVVQLTSIEGCSLRIQGIDMVDGTPVIDIKPYLPPLFPREGVSLGWYDGHIETMLSSKAGEA